MLETNCFRNSFRNDKRIQGMYYPINNQRFCTLRFQGTGWGHKWFWGTGWCHKQLQVTRWRRKRSKKRSKQQYKGRYLHYQQEFPTNIIEEPVFPKDHPSCNKSDWLARHRRCDKNLREFGRTPAGDPKEDHHGRSAQWRAHFLDYKGVKPHGQGRLLAMRRKHCRSNNQVDSTNPKFHRYLWLPNTKWDTRYFHPKAVHYSKKK